MYGELNLNGISQLYQSNDLRGTNIRIEGWEHNLALTTALKHLLQHDIDEKIHFKWIVTLTRAVRKFHIPFDLHVKSGVRINLP